MADSAKRCMVSGRVQGVWFRDTAARVAKGLGISGYAKNLPDGRVEVLAIGSSEAIEQLQAWLWEGSDAARVDTVECQALDSLPAAEGFLIL